MSGNDGLHFLIFLILLTKIWKYEWQKEKQTKQNILFRKNNCDSVHMFTFKWVFYHHIILILTLKLLFGFLSILSQLVNQCLFFFYFLLLFLFFEDIDHQKFTSWNAYVENHGSHRSPFPHARENKNINGKWTGS